MELLTEKLRIRDWKYEDIENTIEGIGNLEVSKWLLVVPHPYTKADGEWWVNHTNEKASKNPREDYSLAIELISEKKVIGGIGLSSIDYFQGIATIGYWLNANYHGKGIMSEAVKEMLRFSFEDLNLRRINLDAYDGNIGSCKIAEKFGFKFEGMKRKGARAKSTGIVHDEKNYGLLREEWEANNK